MLCGVSYTSRLCRMNSEKFRSTRSQPNCPCLNIFLGKIMQQIVKAGLLKSTKGPYGGFSLAAGTLNTPVIRLVEVTDGMEQFSMCVLKLKYCNGINPCPLHFEMEEIKRNYLNLFTKNTFGDLLKESKTDLLKSLAVN